MSLRNELRQPSNTAEPYTWNDWMDNVIPAATGIYSNNSAPLIFFSGFGYDTDDTYPIQRQTWNSVTFTPENYPFQDKIVYEIHNYENSATCDQIQPNLYYNAYCAMNVTDASCPNHGPVVMTEFGFDQTGGSYGSPYAQCIQSTVLDQPGYPGGWMQWILAGSYYIRSGTQDNDETWGESGPLDCCCLMLNLTGLMNHDWSGWRNQTVIDEYVVPFVEATLRGQAT